MNRNKLDITVMCNKHTMREEKFTFEYVYHNEEWLPIMTGSCDNCTNCNICRDCLSAVIAKAQQEKPPFL